MVEIPLAEVLKAGGKVNGLGKVNSSLVDTLALKVLGVLADAPSQEVRRKALEKARRMLGKR